MSPSEALWFQGGFKNTRYFSIFFFLKGEYCHQRALGHQPRKDGNKETETARDPSPDRGSLALPSPLQTQPGKMKAAGRAGVGRQPQPQRAAGTFTQKQVYVEAEEEGPTENTKPEETTRATQDPQHGCSGAGG